MRKFKRILGIGMIVALSTSFIACGSKSETKKADITLEELAKNMTEKVQNKDYTSVSGKMDFDVEVKAEVAGQSQEVVLKGDSEFKSNVQDEKNVKAYAKANVEMKFGEMSNSQSTEMYEVMDGDEVKVYTNVDGEWQVQSQDASEMTEMIEKYTSGSGDSDIDFSKLNEICDNAKVEISGSDYVVSGDVALEKLAGIAENMDLSSLGVDLSQIPDAKINLEVKINKDNYRPKSVKVGCKVDEFEMEGTKIEVPTCEASFSFDSYDDVTIEVPEEALAAE